MMAGTLGRLASRENLLSGALRFGMEIAEANATMDEIKATIEEYWRAEIVAMGGKEEDCDSVRGAFLYPGFEVERNPTE